MSNKTKHTPPPWIIGSRYGALQTEILAYNGGRAICTVWTHAYNPGASQFHATSPHPQGMANLLLIKAAPKLREALDWIVWEIEQGCADQDAILRVAQEAIKEAQS